ncbi:protein of unknown function [Mesotoga infera]|uniref:Uncharacterized protein n=1 Tax=Mesotoga infera TaxID=1236046 RepID=A0A7Z7LHA2_9BACT|nr:protein of unknown function [Mesotoga infera]
MPGEPKRLRVLKCRPQEPDPVSTGVGKASGDASGYFLESGGVYGENSFSPVAFIALIGRSFGSGSVFIRFLRSSGS